MASKLNLNGFSFLSKLKFFAIERLNKSVSLLTRSLVSKIFQSIYTDLIPVFLILNSLVMGCEFVTIVGIGKVGGIVL